MSNRTPFITLISLAAAVVVVLVLTIPGYEQLSQKRAELISEQTRLEEAKEINQKLQDLIAQYNQYKNQAGKISMALPTEEDIPNLLVTLETMAAENGLVLQSLDASSPALSTERMVSPRSSREGQVTPPSKPYQQLDIKMSLNGSYGALKNWLASLEQNLRIIDVKTISFGSGKGEGMVTEEGGASDIFDYDIGAVTYYR